MWQMFLNYVSTGVPLIAPLQPHSHPYKQSMYLTE